MSVPSSALQAAIGLRAHSGWAALVAIEGPVERPSVVLRRRIELSRKLPRQPFHAAEGRSFKEAESLIRRATDETQALASQELRQAVADLGGSRRRPIGCGLLLASGRPLPGLAQILASHALIHAAEGELFRDALRSAGRECRLPMTEVRERELQDRAMSVLGLPAADLAQRLAEWGRALGPPWRQDEKLAVLVAWLALIPPGAAS